MKGTIKVRRYKVPPHVQKAMDDALRAGIAERDRLRREARRESLVVAGVMLAIFGVSFIAAWLLS